MGAHRHYIGGYRAEKSLCKLVLAVNVSPSNCPLGTSTDKSTSKKKNPSPFKWDSSFPPRKEKRGPPAGLAAQLWLPARAHFPLLGAPVLVATSTVHPSKSPTGSAASWNAFAELSPFFSCLQAFKTSSQYRVIFQSGRGVLAGPETLPESCPAPWSDGGPCFRDPGWDC